MVWITVQGLCKSFNVVYTCLSRRPPPPKKKRGKLRKTHAPLPPQKKEKTNEENINGSVPFSHWERRNHVVARSDPCSEDLLPVSLPSR